MSKENISPAKIDKLLEDLFVDTNELRNIGYTKQELEGYCLQKNIPYKSLINRIYTHQKNFKKWVRRGNITNPNLLNSEFEEDRRYWRETAIPFLLKQEIILVRYDKKEKMHVSMAKLENLQKTGKQKIITHLNIAGDEAQIQAQVGGRLIGNTQAKHLMRDIKNIRKLAINMDEYEFEENER